MTARGRVTDIALARDIARARAMFRSIDPRPLALAAEPERLALYLIGLDAFKFAVDAQRDPDARRVSAIRAVYAWEMLDAK